MKKDDIPQQQFSETSGYNAPNKIPGITANTWFGPLEPLPDFAPDNVTGRAWDYPVGYNIMYQPRQNSSVSFDTLRLLAKNCDIMSIIIQSRKDQVESRKWTIKGVEGSDVEEDDPRIKEMTDFWKSPDKNHTFDQWLRIWLDDLFVIDAPALYVRRNKIGGVWGVETIDGSKIKILIDAQGRVPTAPGIAYQMILKGVPARGYTADEVIYSPRNRRSYDPYGCSPVEQTMMTINAAINRAVFNRDYYSEGNIPDAIGWLPESFTPAQAKQFTEWWDSLYSGNLSQRHKVKFVPGKGNFQQMKEPELKNVYDDYIARILCFAMGISSQPFISQMNRATAETAEETSEQAGQQPIENSICNVINKIIQGKQFFGYEDLEFSFDSREDPDPAQQADILDKYVSGGIMSRDAAREILGEEPMGGLAGKLCITTASGIMSLDDIEAQNKLNAQTAQQTLKQGAQNMKQGAEQHKQAMAGDGINRGDPVSGTDPQPPTSKSSPGGDLKKKTAKKSI